MTKKQRITRKNPSSRPLSPSSKASKKGLVMVALGGIGEIGGNCYAYGFNNQWIIVDYGVAFPDDKHLGIEIELPDPQFFADMQKNILAIILTHAHEDHLGGLGYLWQAFRAPIYATTFALNFLKHKLQENPDRDLVPLHALPINTSLELGDFSIRAISITHSIPEARLLAIGTPQGLLVHTGDWNGDEDPLLGGTQTDILDELSEEGVLAMVADSTNVYSEVEAEDHLSEAEVKPNLNGLIAGIKGRVVVSCFASNVARLESVARAGLSNGRQVALLGRSMWRMNSVARESGYLEGMPKFKEASSLQNTSDRECMFIVTGSQGEPRAALNRLSQGNHPEFCLKPSDTVVFSSRDIPGNEKSISQMQDNLALMGVKVISANEAKIHASGHAGKQHMAALIKCLKPKILIPVHGEGRHLVRHIELAKSCGVKQPLLVHNGDVVQFAKDCAQIIDQIDTGKLAIDGERLLRTDSSIFKERRKISFDGVLSVAIAVDEYGDIQGEPEFTTLGLLEEDDENAHDMIYDALEVALRAFDTHAPLNRLCEQAEKSLRQQMRRSLGKTPWVQVIMVEV